MLEEHEFKMIIEENQEALLRYAGRLLNDEFLAQDAVQGAFIKFMKSHSRKIKQARPWLFKILRNHCLSILRKQKRRAEISLNENNDKQMKDNNLPEKKMIQAEDNMLLRQAMNKLKARDKEVLILKFEHGKSYKEIASILGLSVNNVGFILHSVMKELRSDLQEVLAK